MVHCCIIGCKSRSGRKTENISFHRFPKHDSAVRNIWIRATGRLNWQPTKYTCICSRHFEQNCLKKILNITYLYPSSLPTLHVVELSPAISSDMSTIDIQEVKKSSPTSSISDMDTKTFGVPLMENPPTSTEAMGLEISCIPPIKKPSTSTEVMDLETSSGQKITPIDEVKPTTAEMMSPQKQKLVRQLHRKTLLARSRQKELVALRSKYRRLKKKNEELSAVIKKLLTKR